MRLTEYLKKFKLTEEQEQRIIELATRHFGLLPTQVELLRVTKYGWVYPVGYREVAISWDRLTAPVFLKEEDLK